MDDPNLKDAVRPVSCKELPEGLLFAFSDGTTKLIPKFTPPLAGIVSMKTKSIRT